MTLIDGPLWLHIISGGIALLAGLIAILSIKGSSRHILFGKIYSISMYIVSASAIHIALSKGNLFLFYIGVFSVFMVSSAWRSLYHMKSKSRLPKWPDYLIIAFGLGTAIMMGKDGIVGLINGKMFGLVPLVFGLILLLLTIGYERRSRAQSTPKKQWLRGHIAGMGGAYIATCTAFLVVNIQIQPAWVLWLLPTAVGSILISRSVRKWIS